jgi:hypothetical protein
MREDMEMLAMNDILPVRDVPLTSTLNKPAQAAPENQGQNRGILKIEMDMIQSLNINLEILDFKNLKKT